MKCNVKCFEKKKSYTRIDMNFCKYELMKKKKKKCQMNEKSTCNWSNFSPCFFMLEQI